MAQGFVARHELLRVVGQELLTQLESLSSAHDTLLRSVGEPRFYVAEYTWCTLADSHAHLTRFLPVQADTVVAQQ